MMSKHEKWVSRCIMRLVDKFMRYPNFFWRETDMHCYLYNELLKDDSMTFKDSKMGDISLVRREYRTNLYYETGDKKRIYFPIPPQQRKQRGKLDLSIVENPLKKNSQGFNRIVHGIELKYEARKDMLDRTKDTEKKLFENIYKDYRKLTDKKNEIDRGHMLYFVKGENTKFHTLDDIQKHLVSEAAGYDVEGIDLDKIDFIYVEVNENQSPRVTRSKNE